AGIFLKIGSILYGSGYVLFAFLDSELVETGFISRAQLIDAVAVGQITPGPVFSAVTFIGYQVNGFSGAIFSTFAIFLPSFVFVLATQRILPRLKKSALFSAFLQGVNAASVAIIAYALIGLGQSAFSQWSTIAIAAISALGMYFFKTINSAWIVLFGAVSGYILLECGVLQVK
ncbi:MAG: chromate transporter, partial [Leptospiraceae bacterium]|nr:chromate transporter [Leptospiraceae bacterium]